MKKFATLIIISIVYFSSNGQNKYSEWFDLNIKNKPDCIIEFDYYPLSELSEEEFSFYMDSSVNYLTEKKMFFYDTLGFITKGNIKHSMEYEIIELSGYQHEKQFYKDSIIITLPNGFDDIYYCEKIFLDENGFATTRLIKSAGFNNSWYKRNKENRIVEKHNKGCGVDTCGETWEYYTLNEKGDIIKEIVKGISSMPYHEDSTFLDTTYFSYVYDKYDNWILKTTQKEGKILILTERKIKY